MTSDVCRTQNSVCGPTERCICFPTHRRGVRGDDCISEWAIEHFNATCFDSAQCLYNLKCRENRCQCDEGFKLIDDYDCVQRN